MTFIYAITIRWVGHNHVPCRMFFANPPTRQHLVEILRRQWLTYSVADQDDTWEFRMIAESCPDIPWTGVIENIYGTVVCQPIQVHEN